MIELETNWNVSISDYIFLATERGSDVKGRVNFGRVIRVWVRHLGSGLRFPKEKNLKGTKINF